MGRFRRLQRKQGQTKYSSKQVNESDFTPHESDQVERYLIAYMNVAIRFLNHQQNF